MEIKELVMMKVKALGDDYNKLKPRTIAYLEQIETLVQEITDRRDSAAQALSEATFSKTSIAEQLNCSRTTIYKANDAILKRYIDLSYDKFVRESPIRTDDSLKDTVSELNEQIKKMQIRDLKFELQRHDNDVLIKRVEEQQNEINRLQARVLELSRQLHDAKKAAPVMPAGNVLYFDPDHTNGKNAPDDYKLGISFGSIADIPSAIKAADDCGTHSLMVYCNDDNFMPPDIDLLEDYTLVLHGPIAINLASNDESVRTAGINLLKRIFMKCNRFHRNIDSFVLHPGSATSDVLLIKSMKELLPLANFKTALEMMPGKGSELMSTMESAEMIADALSSFKNFSICLDTCHMNDAGYDLANVDEIMGTLYEYIDPGKISLLHINDSKGSVGSHKDRHATIGTGTIPVSSLSAIVKSPVFADIPKIIESPQEEGHLTFADEMRLLLER